MFIDGGPASSPGKSLPIIPYKVTIIAGQTNTLGFTPYLHFQKTTGLVDISNSSVQRVVTQPELPGFQMTIPAGVTITGWDGQPNTQVSIRRVAIDRNPLPPFPADRYSPIGYMYYFGKPGGGTPSAPIPITAPNDLGLPPGTQVELWFYDEAPDGSRPNAWAQFGTGTVSPDGSQVVPDVDPSTGKPFGQPRFCCGAGRAALAAQRRAQINALRGGVAEAAQPATGGEPVNLSTGTFTLTKTDLVLPGRLPVVFTRMYRTNGASAGPFGPGTSHAYHVLLLIESNLRTVLLPSGARLAFPQQADGTFRNTMDPSVRGAVLTASGSNHVLRFKDGTTWTFGAPSFTTAFLIAQSDRNANAVTVMRTGVLGNITAITEPAGRQLTVTNDANNRITAVTDPLGRTVTYTYGPGGLATVTDPAGGVTAYTYDAQGRMTSITDPRGITYLTNTYDANGRVARQTQADGGVWQFAYTVTAGTVTQTVVTDPRGNPTTSRFNGQGYLLSQTDALGQTTTFTRDPATNLLLATTDPLGRKTQFAYDPAGNVTSITDPAGSVRTLTYEPTFNSVTSVTDPLGNITRFGYDPGNGNLLTVTDPLGNTTQIAYNGLGQPMSTTDPLGNVTQFTYNGQGDLATSADPLGNTITRAYDQVSRLLQRTDPRGKATAFTYDPLNRLVSAVDALGGTTAFGYDPNGNLLTATDARGNAITYAYDPMDQATSRTDPLGRPDTYTYDLSGSVTTVRDRKNQTTTVTYDALNRWTVTTYADASTVTATYDAGGRLTSLADSVAGTINWTYDTLNRALSETTPQGTVSYAYDAAGRRTGMVVAGQTPVSYAYDSADRLLTIAKDTLTATYAYDNANRRTTLTLPNGVITQYSYDQASRLIGLTYGGPSGALGALTYTYDVAGNRIAVGGSWARTLLPDSIATASYDAANRQLTFGAKTMTFDPNGNLVSLTEAGQTTTYTWNARDQLASLAGPGMAGLFAYDGTGRRLQKTISGQATIFQYDGWDIVLESGSASVNYLRGLAFDEPLAQIEAAGTIHHLSDALGSTLALTDGTSAVTTSYTYEPFGQTMPSGTPSANAFQYTGRENDGAALYYYRARYYSPKFHRFLSEDPIRLLGGLNFYTYAADDPIGGRDPLGLCNDPGGLGLRYCMNRYIPDPTSFGIFKGDNRGAHHDEGSFKSQQMLNGNNVSSCAAGFSAIVGTSIERQGSVGECAARVSGRKDGGRTISLRTTATQGLLPFAPPIQTGVTIREGPNGEADVKVWGTRYPSVEVWQYGGPGGPKLIYHHTAQGTPIDLYFPGRLPPWSPTSPP